MPPSCSDLPVQTIRTTNAIPIVFPEYFGLFKNHRLRLLNESLDTKKIDESISSLPALDNILEDLHANGFVDETDFVLYPDTPSEEFREFVDEGTDEVDDEDLFISDFVAREDDTDSENGGRPYLHYQPRAHPPLQPPQDIPPPLSLSRKRTFGHLTPPSEKLPIDLDVCEVSSEFDDEKCATFNLARVNPKAHRRQQQE